MPIWAYIYCGLIALGTCFALLDKNRLKGTYVYAGDILDGLCAVMVFLLAYNVLLFENVAVISSLCFIYTFAWSYHAHRHYMNFQEFKTDIHTAVKEEDQKLKNLCREEGLEYTSIYDFPKTERQAFYGYIGIFTIFLLVLVPYFYAYLISVGAIDR